MTSESNIQSVLKEADHAKRESEIFGSGDVISAYSRAQAIRDGVLVDVTCWARTRGFRFPVAVTGTVWVGVIEHKNPTLSEQTTAIVLDALRTAIRSSRDSDRVNVMVPMIGGAIELKAMCGPGDQAEPVITIMYPNED